MIRLLTAARPVRRLFVLGVLGLALAACDASSLFVDPAPPPDGQASLGLALSVGSLGTEQLNSADRVRVQVRRAGVVEMDTLLPLNTLGGVVELYVPLHAGLVPATLEVEVELRSGRQSLLLGSRTLQLQRRQHVTTEIDLTLTDLPALTPVGSVSGGIFHSCAVKADGRAYCWGDNLHGQLGDGTTAGRLTPVAVSGGRSFRAVHAGFVSSCGLDTGGQAFCWGDNDRGVLGTGSAASSSVPVAVAAEVQFASLAMGGLHACGLTSDGRAFCWGFNEFGQLGIGSTADQGAPVAAAPALRFRSLSAGYLHTCGVTTDGRTYCWGYNEYGQLGIGSTDDQSAPVRVATEVPLRSVAAGGLHTCGLTADGQAHCWGYNRFGQAGDGSAEEVRTSPVAVAGAARFASLAAGGGHTCGISAPAGQVHCWGYNRSGALGTGVFTDRREPTPVVGGLVAQRIDAGLHHTCAVSADGAALCWGFNRFGQLGDRSTVRAAEPGVVIDRETPPAMAASRDPETPDALRVLLDRGR